MTDINKAINKDAAASKLAHEKITLHRAKLEALPMRDPSRDAEEELLRVATEIASAADATLTALFDEEEAEGSKRS